MQAVREIGAEHGIEFFSQLSSEQSLRAFLEATEHTVDGASWNILRWAGIVPADAPLDHRHPFVQEIARRKAVIHETFLRRDAQPLPDAVPFVRGLSAVVPDKLAIATGSIRTEAEIFMASSGMKPYFGERIVSREEVAHAKPHPEPFLTAFQRLGLPGSTLANVLAFEDDPLGIASAHEAGMYVVAITSRHTREALLTSQIPPEMVVDRYREVAEYLGVSLLQS